MRGIVVIGSSWGGLHALGALIARLPADFPLPVTIVQHRGRDSTSLLARLLQERALLHVCEVEDKQPMQSGYVYVAPPDYHLLVETDSFSLTTDPLVRYSRPSIDVTFTSAAEVFGASTIGVVLTGANDDGAEGLKRIAARGGRTIVQDPNTAEVAVMPEAAIRAVPTATVLSLADISAYVMKLAHEMGELEVTL